MYKKNSVSKFRMSAIRKLRERLEKLKQEERLLLRDLMGLSADAQKVLEVNERVIVINNHCYKRFYPWKNSLRGIEFRCSEKMIGRNGHANYHGKGIRSDIREFELEELYFRDKAYLMECPSVDRINSHDDYRKDNCRYLEMDENSRRTHKKPNCNL